MDLLLIDKEEIFQRLILISLFQRCLSRRTLFSSSPSFAINSAANSSSSQSASTTIHSQSKIQANVKPIKPRKTHFIAIQLNDFKIHANVVRLQKMIIKKWKDGKQALSPPSELHLTLNVVLLDSNEKVDLMRQLMREGVKEYFSNDSNFTNNSSLSSDKLSSSSWDIELNGLGTFFDSVLFVKPVQNRAMEHIEGIFQLIGQKIKNAKIRNFNNKKFNPHVTVANIKNLPESPDRSKIRIPRNCYQNFASTMFGKEKLTCIQLCSMGKRDDNGYYYEILEEIAIPSTN